MTKEFVLNTIIEVFKDIEDIRVDLKGNNSKTCQLERLKRENRDLKEKVARLEYELEDEKRRGILKSYYWN